MPLMAARTRTRTLRKRKTDVLPVARRLALQVIAPPFQLVYILSNLDANVIDFEKTDSGFIFVNLLKNCIQYIAH